VALKNAWVVDVTKEVEKRTHIPALVSLKNDATSLEND
jgi:hypothetical protein